MGCGRRFDGIEAHLANSKSCPAALRHQQAKAADLAKQPRQRCPRCRSDAVVEGEGFYDFSEMKCLDCGYRQMCDAWQLDDWWSLDG